MSSSATKAADDSFSSGGQAATSSARAVSNDARWLRTEPASVRHALTCWRPGPSSSFITIDHSRGVL
ncbi:hypothetical protein ACIA5D_04030 [Actinoplanes sp. NPDC051513]|uniref:hypothetical protein n=1 Tax=Actinoplanes sp. NPDC051513 TaxID=3363908 RepID=UPI00379A14EC